jgi:DnaJ-domain-containing protein 1
LQHLIRLAISAAKADGPINGKERDAILDYYGAFPWITEFYEQMQNSDNIAPDHNAAAIAAGARNRVTRTLLYVMCADGELNDTEADWLNRFCSAIHMGDTEVRDAVGFCFGRENSASRRSDWAAVLDVPPDSSVETIKRAHRRKASELHPDTLPGVNDTVRGLAEDKLKEVNDAYEHLLADTDDGEEVNAMFALV